MGCNSPRVGHCDARMPRSVRYVRTRPVLLPSPGVYGRIFCPHGWWLCGLFVWRFSSPGKRRPESCTTHVLSGQSAQIPLCGVLSTKRAPFGVGNRRRGIFSMQKHGKIRNVPFPCPCGATGNDAQNFMHRIFAFRGTMPMLKFYVQQRELAVSRRICCICGHCASMFAASRSCARQRSRFCVGRSILK